MSGIVDPTSVRLPESTLAGGTAKAPGGAVQHSEETRGMGTGHTVPRPLRSKRGVLWGTYGAGEDRARLVREPPTIPHTL